MKIKDLKELIKDKDDDMEVQINSIFDSLNNVWKPSDCDGFFHEKDNKIYLTPHIIAFDSEDDIHIALDNKHNLSYKKHLISGNIQNKYAIYNKVFKKFATETIDKEGYLTFTRYLVIFNSYNDADKYLKMHNMIDAEYEGIEIFFIEEQVINKNSSVLLFEFI